MPHTQPTRPTRFVRSTLASLAAAALLAGCASSLGTPATSTTAAAPAAKPVQVKVFVAAMFEIGKNTGDRAGEFQHWYERYWKSAVPISVGGAGPLVMHC